MQRTDIENRMVQQLAYRFWQLRGRPDGSPDEDWLRAEKELRSKPSNPWGPFFALGIERVTR